MGKKFIIGDIHGCHQELLALLHRINPDPKSDTVIFLGDYVDRGPQAREVIEELIKLRQRFPQMITLMGNHEQALLQFLEGRERDFYLVIGGRETLMSYGIIEPSVESALTNMPKEHITFLKGLLPYWEDADYIYVHAGLQPGVPLVQQSTEWLFWANGGRFVTVFHDFGKPVIFGHLASRTPIIESNKIGIDTGAVYGGSLSCLVLPDLEIISVPGKKYWSM